MVDKAVCASGHRISPHLAVLHGAANFFVLRRRLRGEGSGEPGGNRSAPLKISREQNYPHYNCSLNEGYFPLTNGPRRDRPPHHEASCYYESPK